MSVEAGHGHGSNLYAEAVGRVVKELHHLGVAHLVVERVAHAQASHVHFYAVASQFFGQLKLAQFLALQHHPVTHSDLIALLR